MCSENRKMTRFSNAPARDFLRCVGRGGLWTPSVAIVHGRLRMGRGDEEIATLGDKIRMWVRSSSSVLGAGGRHRPVVRLRGIVLGRRVGSLLLIGGVLGCVLARRGVGHRRNIRGLRVAEQVQDRLVCREDLWAARLAVVDGVVPWVRTWGRAGGSALHIERLLFVPRTTDGE